MNPLNATCVSLLSAAFLALACGASPANANYRGFEPMGFPPEVPNGVGAEPRSIQAVRLNHAIKIDGRLDEPAWMIGDRGGQFLRWHPDRGQTPTEETIFKVAYDDKAIYFAVACLEEDPSNITTALSRRDQLRDSDLVSIYVDPYHDKNTGYNFRVNPDGVQEDYAMFNDGERDPDWDAVWWAETSRDEDGWYAEIRIPFAAVRYKPKDSMTWGLQLYRYMQRRGEDTAWTIWGQEENGFISRFGEIRGLDGVESPRRLETMPYFVQRTTDFSESGPDEADYLQNFGVDVKYGVTPDLTLNATVQPDFGQVEADPAVLNLSPFETFFSEKRPFFTEGAQFYRQSDFELFYSRRIGTGDPNSRIRAAGKLTGKSAGNLSIAALYASTDVTAPGQAHNPFKSGRNPEHFFVSRVGRDFGDGNHSAHVMGTAVIRDESRTDADDFPTRDGYTGGTDFTLRFRDRTYEVAGSFVGSHVVPVDDDEKSGHGGEVSFGKYGGQFRGSTWVRWESDKLDLNDAGFLSAPNEANTGGWLGWRYVPGDDAALNEANLNLNFWNSWIYAGETVRQEDTNEILWDYDALHYQEAGGNVNGYMQMRNYWGLWGGIRYQHERTDQFITRGGPLMTRPAEYGGWWGMSTDWRKPISWELYGDLVWDAWGGSYLSANLEQSWNMGSRASVGWTAGFWERQERSDYLDTIERDDPGLGIGGESYVFADLKQRTGTVTVRSNVLFSRNQSVELYLQPFLTVGDYRNAKELVEPDSDRRAAYTGPNEDGDSFDPADRDFRFAAMNLNLVYRWQYRPGSALFLVFTHSRADFEERADRPAGFSNKFDGDALFRNEPENVFLAKLTYWLPI